MSFKYPDLQDRLKSSAAAKSAMLEKLRAAANDPDREKRDAERMAIAQARAVRMAERETARKAQEAELARQAAIAAEAAKQAQLEAERLDALKLAEDAERLVALEAEQKAARDARYAARKAAKKVRRRGY